MEESQIAKFYENQQILITGGTGFIGKVLIEKLLRSTKASTIYVLIRPKQGLNVQHRISKMLEDELFSRVKIENPDFRKRIVEIAGDCTYPELGLSKNDKMSLILGVSIVFHAAACVHFKANITNAYKSNVYATENLLKFCAQIENLESIVHVSTAFSHFSLEQVDEVFYDYPVDYERLQKLILLPSEQKTDVIQGWANNYTFTKAWAEKLIKTNFENLPIGIFRPAIVISTYREPLEHWTDSFGGSAGIISSINLGILRVFPNKNSNIIADLVPVDMTVSALISAAWDITNRKQEKRDVPIYNFVSSTDNPITWTEFFELNRLQLRNFPLNNSLWVPNCRLATNEFEYKLLFLILHYFPAAFLDFFTVVCFRKPRMICKCKKMSGMVKAVRVFIEKNCTFSNNNVKNMWLKMNPSDKQLFPFDMKEVQWLPFFRNYQNGLRLYLHKQPAETLPRAKIRAYRLAILDKLLTYVAHFLGISAICFVFTKIFLFFSD